MGGYFPLTRNLNKWNRCGGNHRVVIHATAESDVEDPLISRGIREAVEESHGTHSVRTNRLIGLVLALFLCLTNDSMIFEVRNERKSYFDVRPQHNLPGQSVDNTICARNSCCLSAAISQENLPCDSSTTQAICCSLVKYGSGTYELICPRHSKLLISLFISAN